MNLDQLQDKYNELFPNSPDPLTVIAPGRVNLLGEHTDYNDGFVFPMAIDPHILFVGATNNTNEVKVYSLDFAQLDVFSLDNITLTHKNTWSNYIRGVCVKLQEDGYEFGGMNIVMQGNIPQGSGLSSSAALEIATGLFIKECFALDVGHVRLVELAQKAENEFVGVNCGIMDQFISMMGKADHALFLDCRSLEYELVPAKFEELGYTIVVINSGVKRGLVDSEYNLRRSQCEQAVQQLKKHLPNIVALRDVGSEHLALVNSLPGDLAKRARHVVTENTRVLDGITALKKNDLTTFGQLLNDSHASLKSDYEVSCPELDILVQIAQNTPGTIGSRMTGAGFGGCTVTLIRQEQVEKLRTKIMEEYPQKTGITPKFFVFRASNGAHRVF